MADPSKHILAPFQDSLESLRHDLLRMASLSRENFHSSIRGLLDRDTDLCNKAIADDEEIDQLEKVIDEKGLQIIMRFTPVASDLRRVISSMKMSTNLERISDHAVNVAKRARKMNKHPELPEVKLIEPIYDISSSILSDAITAFKEDDVAKSLTLDTKDQALDLAHKEFTKKLTIRCENDASNASDYINLIFVARFLERIGDHAVNIGEDCVYASSAVDIRHGGAFPEI